jgi:hypothetical protein
MLMNRQSIYATISRIETNEGDVNITGTRGSNDDPIDQLQKAVNRKNTFYLARCEAVNIDFTTFVVDSIGGIHPDAAKLITRIDIFWARSRDYSVTIARTRLMKRISFCVKRSLAAEYSNRNFEYDDLDLMAIIGEGNEGGRSRRNIILRLALEKFILARGCVYSVELALVDNPSCDNDRLKKRTRRHSCSLRFNRALVYFPSIDDKECSRVSLDKERERTGG